MSEYTIQISAGVGPCEVRRFVALLAAELMRQCERGRLELRSVTVHGVEEAPRSIELEMAGDDVASSMDLHLGTHVLVLRSPLRGKHSRKRWFVGVSMHRTAARPRRVTIEPGDLDVTTARASGPGGQHVNTTNSAVRVHHKPSGIRVRVASERSQHRNRSRALERLAAILGERAGRGLDAQRRGLRRAHYRFERGSAIQEWTVDEDGHLRRS